MTTLKELVDRLELEVLVGADQLDRVVARGYVSDLLSDVMGNAPEDSVWVTMQTHQNVVAVAMLRSLAAVILVNGRKLETEVEDKALEEGIVFLSSDDPAFDLVGKLYEARAQERRLMELARYRADLHVHTCLSPCAELEMVPCPHRGEGGGGRPGPDSNLRPQQRREHRGGDSRLRRARAGRDRGDGDQLARRDPRHRPLPLGGDPQRQCSEWSSKTCRARTTKTSSDCR